MTDKQRLYIKSLRESYGLTQRDVIDLARAYGIPASWSASTAGVEAVEAVAAMLMRQGPEFQRVRAVLARK